MVARTLFMFVVGQLLALLVGENGKNIVIVACVKERQLAFRFAQGLRQRAGVAAVELYCMAQVMESLSSFTHRLELIADCGSRGMHDGEHLVLLILG